MKKLILNFKKYSVFLLCIALIYSCTTTVDQNNFKKGFENNKFINDAKDDSTLLEFALDTIVKLQEINEISKRIRKKSIKNIKGKVFLMLENEFDDSFYINAVDNISNDERVEIKLTFCFNKKDSSISIYDVSKDTLIKLNDWRKINLK